MNVHQFRRPPQPQRKRPMNHDLVAWGALLVGAIASVAWRLFAGSGGGTLIGFLVTIAIWMAFGGGGGSRGPLRRVY